MPVRLLNAILERGLAPDERTARGLILAGRVRVNGRPLQHEGREVGSLDELEVTTPDRPRGARKIAPVLDALAAAGLEFDLTSRACADLGCSTGGFTQELLARGARRVYAVDVAYGVLAQPLRDDSRVVMLERTNARLLTKTQIAEPLERVVGDLSFISWSAVLPAVTQLLAPHALLLLLVKPQFEMAALGRGADLHGGVASVAQEAEVLAGMFDVWLANALSPLAVLKAGIRGAKGNQEYFVLLRNAEEPCSRETYVAMAGEPAGAGE